MQRILFIILLFTGYIYSQQVQPLVADTNSSGAYDVNYIKILGTKNDATHHRLPVDINGGTINATITGGATSANQVPPATLNLSSDTVTIAPGAIDSSKTFATATQYISGNVFSVDGYIKVASNYAITTIIGLAFPYSHTTDFIYSPSVFPKHKIYVRNTGTTTAHILYNLRGL